MRILLFFFIFLFGQSILSINSEESQKIGLTLGLTGILGYTSTFLFREIKYNPSIYRTDPEFNIIHNVQEKHLTTEARVLFAMKKKAEGIASGIKYLNRLQNFFLFLIVSGLGLYGGSALWTIRENEILKRKHDELLRKKGFQ